jgi:hypothetical protein
MTPQKTPASSRRSRASRKASGTASVTVKNVNHPERRRVVDGAMYQAMRRAILKVLPRKSPGLTLAELSRAVLSELSADLFPGGAKAGWWLKTVQLDLEAKKVIAREKMRPLKLHKLNTNW